MKRKKMFLMLAIAVILLSGCSSHSKITRPTEMFATSMIESQKSINLIPFTLNPRLDVADSAFFYEIGINSPSFAWKAVVFQKTADNKWKILEDVAIRV